MALFEEKRLKEKNEVYRTCVTIVLDLFAVLIGVGIHHFFTQGQDDWARIPGYTGWIFWSAFIALLCSALSYFIGGGLYLHHTYVASLEKPHVYLFLFAIASRVVFGVLLLWAAKSPDFGTFICRLFVFEGIGFVWSLVHLGISKYNPPVEISKGSKLAKLWLWTDVVLALFLLALLCVLNRYGHGVYLAMLLIVVSVVFFAFDVIWMVKISLDDANAPNLAPGNGAVRR